jgi:transposase-like protein
MLASKHIFQETKEDYDVLLHHLPHSGYPPPLFAVIDGRRGVKESIHSHYKNTPVQICQAHKIVTVDRYLLKYPRRESYMVLKEIAHGMVRTEKDTFLWQLKEFRNKYNADFMEREMDIQTGKERYVRSRLRLAYHSLIRNTDQLFVCLDFIQTIRKHRLHFKNPVINTTNKIESLFSHLKPKVKIHR